MKNMKILQDVMRIFFAWISFSTLFKSGWSNMNKKFLLYLEKFIEISKIWFADYNRVQVQMLEELCDRSPLRVTLSPTRRKIAKG